MEGYGIEDWLVWLTAHGRKTTTTVNYRFKIEGCMALLEAAGLETDPTLIGDREIHFLKDNLDMSENSARDYMTILGYYCKWVSGRDPVKDAAILWNRNQRDRLFIDAQTFRLLYMSADRLDRVILLLGGYMGLRRAEIVSVRYEDIRDGRLIVYGKGHGKGKRAVLKMPAIVMDAIRAWTEERDSIGKRDESGGRIVVTEWKDSFKEMAPVTVNHRMTRLGERAGVRVTPHSLRRLFATTLHEGGTDIVDIKSLMRHENINTTVQCYIAPNPHRLDGIMDGMNLLNIA